MLLNSSLTLDKFDPLKDSSLTAPPPINHEDHILEPPWNTKQELTVILVKQIGGGKTRYSNAVGNKMLWAASSNNNPTKLETS